MAEVIIGHAQEYAVPPNHDERVFEDGGKAFAAVLDRQDGLFGVSVRLPDGSLRTVPVEHLADEDEAMAAARAFAHELVGLC
jgi:hypothetical protein